MDPLILQKLLRTAGVDFKQDYSDEDRDEDSDEDSDEEIDYTLIPDINAIFDVLTDKKNTIKVDTRVFTPSYRAKLNYINDIDPRLNESLRHMKLIDAIGDGSCGLHSILFYNHKYCELSSLDKRKIAIKIRKWLAISCEDVDIKTNIEEDNYTGWLTDESLFYIADKCGINIFMFSDAGPITIQNFSRDRATYFIYNDGLRHYMPLTINVRCPLLPVNVGLVNSLFNITLVNTYIQQSRNIIDSTSRIVKALMKKEDLETGLVGEDRAKYHLLKEDLQINHLLLKMIYHKNDNIRKYEELKDELATKIIEKSVSEELSDDELAILTDTITSLMELIDSLDVDVLLGSYEMDNSMSLGKKHRPKYKNNSRRKHKTYTRKSKK